MNSVTLMAAAATLTERWRLATDSLATKKNKQSRSLELDARCAICGRDEEDAHHATVVCTKASALRQAMRAHWHLPHDNAFRYTGKDRLLVCLSNADASTRTRILLLL